MRRPLRIAAVVAAAALGALAAASAPAAAHPLGNFTVNHLSRVTAGGGAVHVRYVLDLAEIPAFALDRALDANGTPTSAQRRRWAAGHARAIASELDLRIDGARVSLVPQAATIRARPGAGGLPTLYATVDLSAPVDAGTHAFVYRDRTEPGRLGWKDVVAGAEREPTDELRTYPSALIGSPRTRTALQGRIDANGAVVATADAEAGAATGGTGLARSNALSDVLARGAGDPLVVIGALLLAFGLGALHALEPGHGKTLLAVSLVGARATAAQALILASALTAAHTAGVLALGVALIAAAEWIVPEAIYSWIALASGIVVTVIGARALAREIRDRLPYVHEHVHVHPHAHPHAHGHVHAAGDAHAHAHSDDEAHARLHAIPGTERLTFRGALLAAVSGNIAPCPAAVVVLLAALAQHRVGYGLVLIVAFSLGLAAVLTGLGIAVVRGADWLIARPRFDRVARLAPLLTACGMVGIGAIMIAQGLLGGAFAAYDSPVLVVGLVLAATIGYAFAWHRHPVRTPEAAT
jgi:ABC-type nickel/cobalt efflux system permease component RcnA